MRGLEGKNSVVTGAAGGIGAAAVRGLLDAGASVLAVDVDESRIQEQVVIGPRGRFETIAADVSTPDGVAAYLERAVQEFGGVDLFVNNAGVLGRREALVDYSIEEFDRVMAVNLRGVFLGLQGVLRQMVRQRTGGAIVNTSSIGGLKANRNSSAYSPSKAAVISLSQIAALEHAEHGIRVNVVCPGPTDTGMIADAYGSRGNAVEKAANQPLGRLATPAEIADLMLYLLSDNASFQTGGVYLVDGGALLL